jgi:hypothetical protein
MIVDPGLIAPRMPSLWGGSLLQFPQWSPVQGLAPRALGVAEDPDARGLQGCEGLVAIISRYDDLCRGSG